MSRYPEADEAQRRHYADSFNPYPTSDPFASPPRLYPSPPPPPPLQPVHSNNHYNIHVHPPPSQASLQLDAYGVPSDVNLSSFSNAPTPDPYATPHSQPGRFESPSPPRPSGASYYSRQGDDDDFPMNAGDVPLLRRDPSTGSLPYSMPRVPGSFTNLTDDSTYVDVPESNIRYGRIPQRVPRRYKTVKKIECVSHSCLSQGGMY